MRLFALAALCTALSASAADAPPAPAKGAGKITGRITIAGLAPKLPTQPVTRDNRICGVNKADEALVIGVGGGIKNAVLWVSDVPAPKEPGRARHRLEQQQCRFEPHVLVVPAGATLEVVNADPVLHHPRAQVGSEKAWDYPMPLKGYSVPRVLPHPTLLKISCDAHQWMHAYVQVLDSVAYAVSDDQGNYTISGVPPGKHKLKLWHERLGEREEEVEVPAGETATRDISLTPR